MVVAHWLFGIIAFLCLIGVALVAFTAWVAKRVERDVPPLGSFIDIAGTRLHYLDEGSGPAIVLIHGLGSQMRSLSYALLDLLKSDFRVIFVDRPGSGYSDRPRGASARLSSQAATIADFIQALQLDRPLVVGHSLGGAIALSLGLNHSEQVGGLALIAPLTHPQNAPPDILRGLYVASPPVRRAIAWTLATPLSFASSKRVLETLFSPDPVPRDFGTRGGGFLSLRPNNFYHASSDMVAVPEDLPDMVPQYANLTMPVGVLFGTGDRVLDHLANGEALAGTIAGLDLEMIENGGHMTPISAPSRAALFIRRMAGRVALLKGA